MTERTTKTPPHRSLTGAARRAYLNLAARHVGTDLDPEQQARLVAEARAIAEADQATAM